MPVETTCIPKMPTGPESRLAAFPSATFQQYVYTQKTAKFSGAPPLTPRLRRVQLGGTSQPETSAFPPSGNTGKSSFLCRLHDRKQTSRVYCNTGGISGIGRKADGIGGFETFLQHCLSCLSPADEEDYIWQKYEERTWLLGWKGRVGGDRHKLLL